MTKSDLAPKVSGSEVEKLCSRLGQGPRLPVPTLWGLPQCLLHCRCSAPVSPVNTSTTAPTGGWGHKHGPGALVQPPESGDGQEGS